jgi:hypothetical protein
MYTEVLDGRVVAGGFKGWGGRRRNVYEDTVRFGCLVARSRADENRRTYYIYIQHTDGIKIKWGGGTLRDVKQSNVKRPLFSNRAKYYRRKRIKIKRRESTGTRKNTLSVYSFSIFKDTKEVEWKKNSTGWV